MRQGYTLDGRKLSELGKPKAPKRAQLVTPRAPEPLAEPKAMTRTYWALVGLSAGATLGVLALLWGWL